MSPDFNALLKFSLQTCQHGEFFSKDNLWVKRPGKGPLYAEDYENIIGKQACADIKNDQHLKPEEIVGWMKK